MFGPTRSTVLDSFEYRLIISALDREVRRLQADSVRHRDTYDPTAWAEATTRCRLTNALRNRLERELSDLPAPTEDERRWEAERLLRSAGRIPRSKANAEAHHADVVRRREAADARRQAYWENRRQRSTSE